MASETKYNFNGVTLSALRDMNKASLHKMLEHHGQTWVRDERVEELRFKCREFCVTRPSKEALFPDTTVGGLRLQAARVRIEYDKKATRGELMALIRQTIEAGPRKAPQHNEKTIVDWGKYAGMTYQQVYQEHEDYTEWCIAEYTAKVELGKTCGPGLINYVLWVMAERRFLYATLDVSAENRKTDQMNSEKNAAQEYIICSPRGEQPPVQLFSHSACPAVQLFSHFSCRASSGEHPEGEADGSQCRQFIEQSQ
jgi:hypothetical protein